MRTASAVRHRLKEVRNPEKAAFLPRFFKTGPGEYGEGDRFYGVTVPESRKIARAARSLEQGELERLLASPMHEERLVALLVLVDQFKRAQTEAARGKIYRFYVRNMKQVNNWDLVDGSAPAIVGGYHLNHDRRRLYQWARSKSVWEKRIAILATFHFIKKGDFEDALAISEQLRDDEHDLIHKAVGWMLREIGNRDRSAEERFLERHYRKMPRTMLRYAIEKFPGKRRQAYLKGDI